MVIQESMLDRLPPPDRAAYVARIDQHNTRTRDAFEKMAAAGGGEAAVLADSDDLVPTMMHLTIDEAWWPAFDAFYTVYLEVSR